MKNRNLRKRDTYQTSLYMDKELALILDSLCHGATVSETLRRCIRVTAEVEEAKATQ